MFAYSARKNSANRMPLYSVWKPPVSSCSASGRSNGARLVSARPPMKKMHERHRLDEREPHAAALSCASHDADHAERAGHQDDADERQRDRDFVADQLRRRAQAGEQRILAVRRVAREDDAVDADRRHRHDVEQADVDVGDVERHLPAEQVHLRPERNHRVDDQRRHHRDDRRRREHPLVGARPA